MGVLLSKILMITYFLVNARDLNFWSRRTRSNNKRCLCLCTSVGWFFSFTQEPLFMFLTFKKALVGSWGASFKFLNWRLWFSQIQELFELNSKTMTSSISPLTLLNAGNFIDVIFYIKIKIKNCENIDFSNKLKLIIYLIYLSTLDDRFFKCTSCFIVWNLD
jgi:hypothetical protein